MVWILKFVLSEMFELVYVWVSVLGKRCEPGRPRIANMLHWEAFRDHGVAKCLNRYQFATPEGTQRCEYASSVSTSGPWCRQMLRWVPFRDPKVRICFTGQHFWTMVSPNASLGTSSGPNCANMFHRAALLDQSVTKCFAGYHFGIQRCEYVSLGSIF